MTKAQDNTQIKCVEQRLERLEKMVRIWPSFLLGCIVGHIIGHLLAALL